MTNRQLLQEEVDEIIDLVEDIVSFYCDENMASGEIVWAVIHALSDMKLDEFPSEFDLPRSETS